MALTQDQNLLFQSYFTVVLMAELKRHTFLKSEFFEQMQFGSPWIKDALPGIGIDNQGFLLMTLYTMLVIPREKIKHAYAAQYERINDNLSKNAKGTQTNYASDHPKVDFLKRIRNAVAHARVEFQQDMVFFRDELQRNKKTFKFVTGLPLSCLGQLIHDLQEVHLQYIRDLQAAV